MNSNSCKLKEVPVGEMSSLREELGKSFPAALMMNGLLDIRLRYGPLEEVNVRIYQAASAKFGSFVIGTPVAIGKKIKFLIANWNPDEVEDENAAKLFLSLPDWDWVPPFALLFESSHLKRKFDAIAKKYLIAKEIDHFQPWSEEEAKTFTLSLTKLERKIPEIPPGYVIKRLPPSCASTLLAAWKFNFSDTESGLSNRLATLQGLGAFHTDSDGVERLVGWTHQYIHGAIGMTYTVPEERGKGLAGALTLTLATRIMEEGRTPFLMTEGTNLYNKKFHENLGFRGVGETCFSVFLPQGVNVDDL